jgi:hypothetical protein
MSSAKNKPLGFNYKGFKVTPAQKFYYYEYPYKLHCKGNLIYRDIKRHTQLDDLLRGEWWTFQSQYTSKSRVLYIKTLELLDKVIDKFPDLIDKVYGPLDETHALFLENPYTDTKFSTVYKEKLWYNKYDIKMDIKSRELWTWKSQSKDLEKPANDFVAFMQEQTFDYHLYLNTDAKYWHQNYLYLKTEDFNEIQPWISMSYSEVIEKINSAVIYPTDK